MLDSILCRVLSEEVSCQVKTRLLLIEPFLHADTTLLEKSTRKVFYSATQWHKLISQHDLCLLFFLLFALCLLLYLLSRTWTWRLLLPFRLPHLLAILVSFLLHQKTELIRRLLVFQVKYARVDLCIDHNLMLLFNPLAVDSTDAIIHQRAIVIIFLTIKHRLLLFSYRVLLTR